MKPFLIAAALSLVAGQGAALSCMRPDVARTFQYLSDDPAPYYVIYGTLKFDESLLPQGVVNAPRDPAPIAAQFDGHGLTLDGFATDFRRAVTLQPVCSGPWCGGMASGVPVLAFAKVEGGEITIEADACGSTVFPEPSRATLAQVTSCMRGEKCEPMR